MLRYVCWYLHLSSEVTGPLSQLFMPTVVVSKAFVDKVMESVVEAQVFCENNRDVIERIYGPPPGPEGGFQSFPRTQTPYDRK